MENSNWFDGVPFAVTVCDKNGIIVDMNEKSAVTFAKDGGKDLIHKSLLDCHPEKARSMILNMIKTESTNVYTIEKHGVKKLIYQCPWYQNGELGGLVELSVEIPFDMPHHVRS